MKKLIAMLLAMVMVLGLVACAAKTEPPAADTKPETPLRRRPQQKHPLKRPRLKKRPLLKALSRPT